MKTLSYSVPLLLCGALLQGCGGMPARPALATTPLLRIDDSAGLDAPALYQLGRYHERRGELAAASAAYARSLALAPRQLDARNAQAALLAGQGQLDAAVVLLQQLVADFPGLPQPHSNLAYAYYLQGRDADALSALQRALALDPAYAPARANLSLLQARNGAAAATAAAPATAPVQDAAPALIEPAPSRLQLVQLAPNEFRLQARPAPQAVAAAVPVRPAPSAALQIVNGNGVRGLGARVRRVLASHGIEAGQVRDQRGFTQRVTVIEYLPGQRAQADAMLLALRGHATLKAVRALPAPLSLRLVLGSDHATRLAALRPAPATLALAALAQPAVPHFNQE